MFREVVCNFVCLIVCAILLFNIYFDLSRMDVTVADTGLKTSSNRRCHRIVDFIESSISATGLLVPCCFMGIQAEIFQRVLMPRNLSDRFFFCFSEASRYLVGIH